MFGRPDYFLRIAVAGHAAYEAFLTGKLIGLPGVLHVTSPPDHEEDQDRRLTGPVTGRASAMTRACSSG